MTIAIAILAQDGSIVMAADTLVSGGYLKNDEIKIATISPAQINLGPGKAETSYPWGVCGIAGAGHAGYVDALAEKLSAVFVEDQKAYGVILQARFESCLKDFHKDHIIPMAVLPDPPEVFMLMGIHRQALIIYVTEGSTIRMRPGYAAVGIGADAAYQLFQRYGRWTDVKSTQVLAAYVVFRVKETVNECGNYTTVVTLHPPKIESTGLVYPTPPFSRLSWDYVDGLERMFRMKWLQEERNMIWRLISECPPPP